MTCRISRILKRTGPNPLLGRGRKPRILPMSREDQRQQEEINRRRRERLARDRAAEEQARP